MTTQTHTSHQGYEEAECAYYRAGSCSSCGLLANSPGTRLEAKLALFRSTLQSFNLGHVTTNPPVTVKHPWHSRHKVKMSVSGSTTDPVIGITRQDTTSIDLVDCALSAAPIASLLHYLRTLISTYSLTPYDIERRTGELKHIIVMTTSNDDQAIVRFILRSSEAISRLSKAVGPMQKAFPWITAVSANIQPLPAAILEGPDETILTENAYIREHFGSLPLYLAPQSFMQVTPEIAKKLYQHASEFVLKIKPSTLLDLFCGVGGFSLSVAPQCGEVIGVELSAQAIECARRSAQELGYANVSFHAYDVDKFLATTFPLRNPEVVLVNPPRRGLSAATIAYLHRVTPIHILYSSCNPETFCRDVQNLSSHYEIEQVTPFDMFPMTKHWEVFGVLNKRKS